jgi:DNA processing protein
MRDLHERCCVLAVQHLFFRHPAIARALFESARSARAIFEGDRSRWREAFGAHLEPWQRFTAFEGWPQLERDVVALEGMGARILCLVDPAYPPLLREIVDPPPVLVVLGDATDAFLVPAVAIVGARRAGAHGRAIAAEIACGLAERGYVVASGMAYGIDAAAHRGALYGGGQTIAVAGCGPDIVYPPSNASLASDIVRAGLRLTEFPLGELPHQSNFPQRNRVISGLTLATVVIEAAEQSGSLITARFALEQGREVMAVPGAGGAAMARGVNRLIRDGAALVESAADVAEIVEPLLRTRPFLKRAGQLKIDVDMDSPLLCALTRGRALSVDAIVAGSGLPASDVLAELARLAVVGFIEELPGRRWRRAARRG